MARRKPKGQAKKRGARGPVRARKGPTKVAARITDPRIEAAILAMNRGQSLTAAARASYVSRRRLLNLAVQHRLVKRKGRRWLAKDNRLRRVQIMTRGRPRPVVVRGYEPARLVGEHHEAAGEFVRTNNIELLKPFMGRYPLETDPNALHRIAAMDSLPFHEIYEITSST